MWFGGICDKFLKNYVAEWEFHRDDDAKILKTIQQTQNNFQPTVTNVLLL